MTICNFCFFKENKNMQYIVAKTISVNKLYKELNVPIGILNCSFSQTSIQAWVPREGYRDDKDEYISYELPMTFDSPYINSEFKSGKIDIKYDGEKLELDFNK